MGSNNESGWLAKLQLGFVRSGGRTVLAERRREGPLAVQRPFYPEGDVCHVYLLHPPGGVVGGDRLNVEVSAGEGASALMTTPGATKFYRSAANPSYQTQDLSVADKASLEWFPQESILFPGALTHLRTRVNLAASARFAGWEILCLGRPVVGEIFSEGYLDQRFSLHRDGQPLALERLHICGAKHLSRATQLRGYCVSATMLVTPVAPGLLNVARAAVPAQQDHLIGITLIDELLIARYLGNGTEQAKARLSAVWSALRPAVFGRTAGLPRIWAT
ncbi:MAG: urease accessory protein UreD [Chromatiales bacterium]|nr:urease accessory protein UreD [Chromatiales bacterium]